MINKCTFVPGNSLRVLVDSIKLPFNIDIWSGRPVLYKSIETPLNVSGECKEISGSIHLVLGLLAIAYTCNIRLLWDRI